MRSLIELMARNNIFANLLMIIILVSGIFGVASMNREFFPNISFDMVQINMLYPGATPAEIEEGICQRFEEAVEGVEGIKKFHTTALEGVGMGFAEVDDGADEQKVLDDIRAEINAIPTFPADAEKPVVSLLTNRTPVCRICLRGDLPQVQLKEKAEEIKDDLLRIPTISMAAISGIPDYEISIEVSEERLRSFGLTFEEVAAKVRRECLNLPGGFLRTDSEQFKIRAMGRRYRGGEFADLVVLTRPDGTLISLDRIAEIKDGFEEDPMLGYFNGERAALIVVFKTWEEDAIAISEAVDRYLADKNPTLPPGLTLTKWGDTSEAIRDRIDLLLDNGRLGLVLVFFLLWFFLGFKLGFWVAMGIPISLLGAMAIAAAHDKSINMISLFGLVMVLGIIVDDAIVVGEAISLHRRQGKSALRAAIDGTLEVLWPVVAAVCTSIAAFLPLFWISGIMGKFIALLPMVVVAALVVSLVECFFLLPAHLNHLADPGVRPRSDGRKVSLLSRIKHAMSSFRDWMERIEESFVRRVYAPCLRFVIGWRYVALASTITVIMVMAGVCTLIQFVMFPDADHDTLIVRAEFPDGTPITTTCDTINKLENGLRCVDEKIQTASGDPLVRNVYSVAGAHSGYVDIKGAHYCEVTVDLLPSEERGVYFKEINLAWEENVGPIDGALSVKYGSIEHGPPGKDIEIWLLGDDFDMLLAASAELQARLAEFKGVYEIEDDFRPGKTELRISLKPLAYTLGLTLDDVGRQLRQGYYGAEPVRIQRGRDDVRIKVRYPLDERNSLADLESIRIRTRTGNEVPFVSVADVEFTKGLASVNRKDGKRRVSVTAETVPGVANAREVIMELQANFLPGLQQGHSGLICTIEGEQQDSRESMESLFYGFFLAIMLIYLILSTIFRSYVQPLLILFTVPLGLVGALLGHLILGENVTMMSLFGMVALTGIVVNDAIVLMECVNQKIAAGVPFMKALVEGGCRRFRAIMLTSLTTCAGLFPIIMEKSVQAQYLIPMALSIASGVIAATLLTLFLLPCLMATLNDVRIFLRWTVTGVRPSREEVEPARKRIENNDRA